MTRDGFSDDELHQAAKLVVKSMMDSLPRSENCHHEFSPEFLAKMEKIIIQQRSKEARDRIARRVASFALALLIGAGAWLTVDTDARAAFLTWVREVYEDSFIYRYFGEKQQEMLPDYDITDLPEGYSQTSVENDGNMCIKLYENSDRAFIFMYYQMQDGWEHIVSEKEADIDCLWKEIEITGNPADLYYYKNETSASELIWINEKTGIVFHLTGFFTETDLINMAESIK